MGSIGAVNWDFIVSVDGMDYVDAEFLAVLSVAAFVAQDAGGGLLPHV
jgi:hypothetical protein